jgi:hypothetical protein
MKHQLAIAAMGCLGLMTVIDTQAQTNTATEDAPHLLDPPSCPSGRTPQDARKFRHGGISYTALLCLNEPNSENRVPNTLSVLTYRSDRQLAAEITVPLDIEGQVRSVKFDETTYVLSSNTLTLPVLVDARLRGFAFDQYTTDLLLFTLKERQLRQVLSQNVRRSSWASSPQCEASCLDTTITKTTVIILPAKPTNGMQDLQLHTRGKTVPEGVNDKLAQTINHRTNHAFNGQVYEAVP